MATAKRNVVDGKIDQVKGRAKASAGKVTNNKSLEAKGRVQQVKGTVKEAVGKTKRAVKK